MRVLHVIPSIAAIHGGPSQAIKTMESVLKSQGVDIETATTNDAGKGKFNDRHCQIPLDENGVKRWYFHKSYDFYKVSISFYKWINQHIGNYDLIHIHALFSFTSTTSAFAAIKHNIPYVIRPLGTLSSYGITQSRPLAKKLSIPLIEKKILTSASAVHFTSEFERNESDALNIKMNSYCIPLGISDKSITNKEKLYKQYPSLQNKKVILYLARIHPVKNIEGLLDAFAHCLTQLPDIILLIAGDGEQTYIDSIKKIAQRNKIGDSIIWTGFLSGQLKESAFDCADIYVLPSLSENFGISIVEALIRGIPCLVSHKVAISKQISDSQSGLVTSYDSKDIADGILKILQNPDYARQLSNNAKQLASDEFSSSKMGASLLKLYKTILS